MHVVCTCIYVYGWRKINNYSYPAPYDLRMVFLALWGAFSLLLLMTVLALLGSPCTAGWCCSASIPNIYHQTFSSSVIKKWYLNKWVFIHVQHFYFFKQNPQSVFTIEFFFTIITIITNLKEPAHKSLSGQMALCHKQRFIILPMSKDYESIVKQKRGKKILCILDRGWRDIRSLMHRQQGQAVLNLQKFTVRASP